LFGGWREELASCRKFSTAARNYTACRLMADVGLRVNATQCGLEHPCDRGELPRDRHVQRVGAADPDVSKVTRRPDRRSGVLSAIGSPRGGLPTAKLGPAMPEIGR
jgi:hypothetical protein